MTGCLSKERPFAATHKSLGEKLSRLQAMSLREILFRGRAAATISFERGLLWAGMNPAGRPVLRMADVPPRGKFFFDPGHRSEVIRFIERRYPEWITRATERADNICRDPWFQNPRWRADRAGRAEWPNIFYAGINIFSGDQGYGDIRSLWEVNRHAALVDLAKAHYLTGDETYRRRCVELWLTWRQQNPYAVGVNWTSALEVAMRALAWVWVYFFLGGHAGLRPREREQMLVGLHQHGVYIERHLSEYFSPNNHLVGEATALYVLGSVFPELRKAARWKPLGWAILRREMEFQFHEDGGCVEQATCYHHFTLGLYLQAIILGEIHGYAIDPKLCSRLEHALWFTVYLTRPDGRVPMIGDNDNAVACPAGEREGWDFRHYLAVGAALFGRPEFRWASGGYSELAYWLLGEAGWERYKALPELPPQHPSALFRQSGYGIMRSAWSPTAHYLCLDCGSLAPGALRNGAAPSAHAHADALALEVSAYGKPILVDPGTYTYNGDPAWHRYFRETASHNTLVIDGQSQSEFAGRLRWRHGAETALEVWESVDAFDYAQASHDGYRRGLGGVRHRRGVFFARSSGWIIWDRLEGTGTHHVAVPLHFHPGVAVEPLGTRLLARNGEACLAIEVIGPSEIRTDLVRGRDGPGGGWFAPAYGRRQPASVVQFTLTATMPATIWQVLYPSLAPGLTPSVTRRQAESADALLVEVSGRSDLLILSHHPGSCVTIGSLKTDALLVWLWRESSSDPVRGALLKGSYVRWIDKYVRRAPSSVEYLPFEAYIPSPSLDPALPAA